MEVSGRVMEPTVYLLANSGVLDCGDCKEKHCADWEVRSEGGRIRYYCGYCLAKRNLGHLTMTATNKATMKWRMARIAGRNGNDTTAAN